jgi:hypothetical protein
MTSRAVHFVAIVLAALALVPAGAHLFALPNKIGMGQGQYFTAQSVYSGWAFLGLILIGALISNGALAMLVRDELAPFRFALAATLCFALSLIVFFVWVFPANQATHNWTAIPNDWRALRVRWEYGHALSAILGFVALCATTLSALSRQ